MWILWTLKGRDRPDVARHKTKASTIAGRGRGKSKGGVRMRGRTRDRTRDKDRDKDRVRVSQDPSVLCGL